MSAAGCQAKIPIGVFQGNWWMCGQPVTAVHIYRCACGHEREGRTCAEHEPEPGKIGCAQCLDAGDTGHDCDMTATPAGSQP